jgi:hypothetical protein
VARLLGYGFPTDVTRRAEDPSAACEPFRDTLRRYAWFAGQRRFNLNAHPSIGGQKEGRQ